MPREPRPIQLEPRPMPANDCFRLDEHQRPFPSWPKPPHNHPNQFVGSSKARLWMLSFQDGNLRRQAVAGAPDFPRADCGENRQIERVR
jgi:hypothetical protein